MGSSLMKIDVISADIPSSNVEFEISKFVILSENSLLTSTLSFKREDDTLSNGHDTLVFRLNIPFSDFVQIT